MTTMVIDRRTLPESLSSLIGAPRVVVQQRQDGGEVLLSPVIDPADFDNDTDYLNAIPGMVESLIEARNASASERIPLEDIWPDV